MRTIILAAGLGTRLRPLTDTLPKALVSIGGKTLLQHTLETLIRQGATEAVVNVHHFGQQIIDYLQEHPTDIPVHISDERALLLNTGGGIRQALKIFGPLPAPPLGESPHQGDKCALQCPPIGGAGALDNGQNTWQPPVLIHNVDIFSNADLRGFYERNKGYEATLLVSPRPSTRQLIVRDDLLVGWTNLTTGEVRGSADGEQYAFSGIHLISPTLADATMGEWPQAFSIMDYYLDVCTSHAIHVEVCPDLRLLDVGKMDTLAEAEQRFKLTVNSEQ